MKWVLLVLSVLCLVATLLMGATLVKQHVITVFHEIALMLSVLMAIVSFGFFAVVVSIGRLRQ